MGDEVLKDFVHHHLEGRGTVGESEVHHELFEQPAIRSERCLPFITFLDTHIVVSPSLVLPRLRLTAGRQLPAEPKIGQPATGSATAVQWLRLQLPSLAQLAAGGLAGIYHIVLGFTLVLLFSCTNHLINVEPFEIIFFIYYNKST